MEKDIFVTLRRPYIEGSDEPQKWESVGYFASHEEAVDALGVGSEFPVNSEYNVGDLFIILSVDHISDIENAETQVYIVTKDKNIEWTLHCFELESKSWFSGWEGHEAHPIRLINTAFKAGVHTREIIRILAECCLASIEYGKFPFADVYKSAANDLIAFSEFEEIQPNGPLDSDILKNGSIISVAILTIFHNRKEIKSPACDHPMTRAVIYIMSSMPSYVDGRAVMVDIINKHIPLSRILLLQR